LRTSGGRRADRGFGFDAPIGHDGYAWWYIDAVSDDGNYALVIIAFVGSVFSPYYAGARRRGPADPMRHCAINVALYGPRRRHWTMTERDSIQRGADYLAVGPSSLEWDGDSLVARIDEWTAPLPERVRGTVRLRPGQLTDHAVTLDPAGEHVWCPIAPNSRIEVAFDAPDLRWQGEAYVDANAGTRPLESGFRRWDWSRARAGGGTTVLYEVTPRAGNDRALALNINAQGDLACVEPPPHVELPRSRWGVHRTTRSNGPAGASVAATLEDGPFYTRSLVTSELWGEPVIAVHESICLDRFSSRVVQAMLSVRMPRLGGRRRFG
jgi:carotenoid 1,2-hydratase